MRSNTNKASLYMKKFILSIPFLARLFPTAAAQDVASALASLPFHQTTVIASHNAHANRAAANSFFKTLGINQESSIYDQLSVDGVRALLLDIKLDGDELRLVHDPLDYGGFQEEMEKNLVPFLKEDSDAVVSLYLQTVGDVNTGDDEGIRKVILEKLQEALRVLVVDGVPLKELTFKYDDEMWANHEDWPTISELRFASQRLFIFSDRSEFASSEYGIMHNQQVLRENDWMGIASCISRFMWQSDKVSLPNNSKWTRLFFMNHWCCQSGAESFGTVVPQGSKLLGGGDNGWGVLYPRIKMCMENNGQAKPNFIALDWVIESEEARGVARFLNFGGALGTKQACESNEHCATSSCNGALNLCQCNRCSEDGCGGCSPGEICLANGDGLNECRSIQIKQEAVMTQEQNATVAQTLENIYYCGESYSGALGTACGSVAVPCPNGNSDCPENEVCFGPFECTVDAGSDADNEGEIELSIEDILQQSQTENSSVLASESSAPFGSKNVTTSPSPTAINVSTALSVSVTSQSPEALVMMYCGESYGDAKDRCSPETTCPGGYECPSGLICFQDIKCFTRPPSKAPTTHPTQSPSESPTNIPTDQPSLSPTSSPPSQSPTPKPTFDFSNEFYCGANYTMAQMLCYTTAPCPGGDPTVCEDGQTCYSGIKCYAPPTVSPTFRPSTMTPTSSLVSGDNAGFGSRTTAPFIWPQISGDRKSTTFTSTLVIGLHLIVTFVTFSF